MSIDQKTHIPLFTALSAIPFIVGGMFWLTTIDNKAAAAQEELKSLRPIVEDIHDRTIRIEEYLKRKNLTKEN